MIYGIPDINTSDYTYDLPAERIAKFPLEQRDASKLLLYDKGRIDITAFRHIPELIPDGSMMVFNNTKVIPARMYFRRSSGAAIELFCLSPVEPADYQQAFSVYGKSVWKCIAGNAKRWKQGQELLFAAVPDGIDAHLGARLLRRDGAAFIVEFSWTGELTFSQILELFGSVPIPPYLERKTEAIDKVRYQTVYADIDGSVAAPTAGLHFTDSVLDAIRKRGIDMENVCLHVGAGTFLPVKDGDVTHHRMHREPFSISLELIEKLASKEGKLVAVGTTSVRTLESLYYIGVSCIETGRPADVEQWAPYIRPYGYSYSEALEAIAVYLRKEGLDRLVAGTEIIIVPGFEFRAVDVMVTNFHQPESTLILLIAAFIGEDWRKVYSAALDGGFRFLSYGDSSILFR